MTEDLPEKMNFEKMFKSRYTDEDPAYAKIKDAVNVSPPCIFPWYSRPKRSFDYTQLNKKRQYEEDDPKRNDAGNGSNERFHDDRGGAYGRDNNRGGYGGYGGRGNNFRSGYNRGYDRGGYNRGGYNNRDRDELHTRDEERKSFVSYPGKR